MPKFRMFVLGRTVPDWAACEFVFDFIRLERFDFIRLER